MDTFIEAVIKVVAVFALPDFGPTVRLLLRPASLVELQGLR